MVNSLQEWIGEGMDVNVLKSSRVLAMHLGTLCNYLANSNQFADKGSQLVTSFVSRRVVIQYR